ncbi:MAG: acyl-CoA dehydrogenase family protein, partial [Nitrospirota bacterium]
MDFLFTEEHKALREMVRDFARNEIAPLALKMDEDGDYPKELIGKMAQLGLMGITMPVEYGGAGMDPLSQVIAMEEISRASASISVVMAVNNGLVCEPIYHYGTEEQKRRYLVKLAKGEMLGCYGLTEPGSGSDALALSTSVKKVADGYIIN